MGLHARSSVFIAAHEIFQLQPSQVASPKAQWVKNLLAMQRHKRRQFNPWVGQIPWRRKWQLTPILLTRKSHGQRNLAGYSPWGTKSQTRLREVALMVENPPANAGDLRDTGLIPGLERSPGGGGHGNPFPYSCLENSMDRGAWWALVHEVAELDMTKVTEHKCM